MADLTISFAGVEFRNPVWVASQGPPSSTPVDVMARMYERYVEKGAAAVETPWISVGESSPDEGSGKFETRYVSVSARAPFGKEGLFAISPVRKNRFFLEEGRKLIRQLKKTVDVPIIANAVGPGADIAEWVRLAEELQDAGCDLLELNFSCPMASKSSTDWVTDRDDFKVHGIGVMIGQVPSLAGEITHAVKKASQVPVMVKMTPEVGFPHLLEVAESVRQAGADAITAINAPISMCPPDIYNGGRPRFPGATTQAFGATYGPWNRFIAYKFVSAIRRYMDIDVSAVGGIVDPEHVVEMLMLGASTVQLSSGIIWRGSDLVTRAVSFLDTFLSKQGYNSVSDIVGLAHNYITDLDEVEFVPSVSTIDQAKCKNCGICYNNICSAIAFNGTSVTLDPELCVGCGICAAICPLDCFTIAPRHSRRE